MCHFITKYPAVFYIVCQFIAKCVSLLHVAVYNKTWLYYKMRQFITTFVSLQQNASLLQNVALLQNASVYNKIRCHYEMLQFITKCVSLLQNDSFITFWTVVP